LALLLKGRLKLSHIIASAISFGIAVLTKENAIFFAPVLIYTVYSKSHLHHKRFAIVQWIAFSIIVISNYFLYAILKGEFFAVGFLGNNTPHVSLLTTLHDQFIRGATLPFWEKRSDFYLNLMEWLSRDKYTIGIGGIATIISAFISFKEKSLRIPAFLAVVFWVFLMRGKLVIDFYIIPIIPLLSLNIGMVLNLFLRKISFNKKLIFYPISTIVVILLGFFITTISFAQYTKDETTPQVEAIDWVKKNLSEKTFIVIDDYAYVDLHEARFPGDQVFNNADWFWKLFYDPQIREVKYGNDWKKIEYITLTHEMLKQVKVGTQDFLKVALDNSSLITEWKDKSTSYIDLTNYISTNGDWVSIYKIKSLNSIVLDGSWRFYEQNFIKSYGQVINPNNNDVTTSEGQSYALLRAVWQGDKESFDRIWAWTKDHFQYRKQDKLFSWLWIKEGYNYKLGDSATASDADEDIALALLFAHKRWGDTSYLSAAKEIINDIWKQEVVKVNGHFYLISGTGAERDDGYLVNPSYVSPATYRIFAQVDTKHPWAKLADDSYTLLNQLGTQNKNNKTYLPPNWILIDKNTGEIKSAKEHINDKDVDAYGFDAFRTMWRVALDAVWFKEPNAAEYLREVEPFFVEQWEKDGKFAAIYNLSGTKRVSYSTLSTDTGVLSIFAVTNQTLAKDVHSKLYDSKFKYDFGYWGDKDNYYDQNWAWFGTALYTNNLPNLWGTN
ncbi:MAG: hypothetical protein ACD_19C00399G0001, partial [uncultured bacterium]